MFTSFQDSTPREIIPGFVARFIHTKSQTFSLVEVEKGSILPEHFHSNEQVSKVYYPGLKSHPNHKLAKKQMKGYTGMLSFELEDTVDVAKFLKSLELIKPSMSLAGVESTILEPSKASHALLGEAERKKQGISEGLLRLSVGIENKKDIISDLEQAFERSII